MRKWVGFDMDECIGSLMPLYAFVTKLPKAHAAHTSGKPGVIYEALKKALIESESRKQTWLLRPAFYDALALLYDTYKSGKIYGAFIFSNNGSQDLVDFMVYYCNEWMAWHAGDVAHPSVFKMGVCRGSPLRSPGSLVKSLSEIQGALARQGLPMLESSSDLLFFDDMVHELSSEIRDYVKVRPYVNICPLDRVIIALRSLESLVGSEVWNAIVKLARHYQAQDKDSHYLHTPPTVRETVVDKIMFYQAFMSFLGQRTGAVRKYSRRNRKSLRNRTRKHTVLAPKNLTS